MVIGAVAATWVSVTASLRLKNAGWQSLLGSYKKIDSVVRSLNSWLYHPLLVADGQEKVSPNLGYAHS